MNHDVKDNGEKIKERSSGVSYINRKMTEKKKKPATLSTNNDKMPRYSLIPEHLASGLFFYTLKKHRLTGMYSEWHKE
jgi:hypothetical protein